MKKKDIYIVLTNQYLKNIAQINKEYTNALHLLYREWDSVDEEVRWIFWELENMCGRFGSYLIDKEEYFFHEEDIYKEAKKAKENYDSYK